jgi:DNA repair protein RadA/Sms
VSKTKTSFSCTNCGYISIKWVGCCPGCNEWNSLLEQQQTPSFVGSSKNASGISGGQAATLVSLAQISSTPQKRMTTGIREWDAVLGGGILPGSFIILTGDPGIGKSTLLLQVADAIAAQYTVVYFSSEESLEQVKGRALRLGVSRDTLLFSDEACLETIIATAQQTKPALLVVDSIQNCHLSPQSHAIPGTVAQLRESAFYLMRLAKENDIAVLITGHITKEGEMAGPKVLEHMVDAVFYLQAEDRWHTRILRSVKNRFGTINEVGFFEMHEKGLVEVADVNQQFIGEASGAAGAALVCCMEGTRPILLELQALVVESKFGMPQRVVTGLDPRRVVLVAAILEKYLHIRFSAHDIFFKVSGGFKIKESSADLGIALALLSSYFQKSLPSKSVALGEISLTGQIKSINQISACIKEIEKFGLDQIFVAKGQQAKATCAVVGFRNIYDLLQLFPEGE